MKKLIIAWTIFLSSCNGIPPKSDIQFERCFTILQEKVTREDGQDFFSGYCRCHQYSVNKSMVGRSSESVNRPLNYCDKHGGLSGKSWEDFSLYLEKWRLYLISQ